MFKLIKFIFVLFTLLFISCSQKEDYVFYRTIYVHYEIGYDSQNRVYFTDKRTNEQIVFICEGPEYSTFSKEDLLDVYKNTKSEYLETGDYCERVMMRACKNDSFSSEVVYSKRFKSDMTRYYIKYEDAYGQFHI